MRTWGHDLGVVKLALGVLLRGGGGEPRRRAVPGRLGQRPGWTALGFWCWGGNGVRVQRPRLRLGVPAGRDGLWVPGTVLAGGAVPDRAGAEARGGRARGSRRHRPW